MMARNGTVFVVDDDPSVREAMEELIASLGFKIKAFASAAEYVASATVAAPACLVLDVMLPDMNGLELQRQLAGRRHPPIIFITGHGDIPSTVRAMKAGAVDFLAKPFGEQELLTAIESAMKQHHLEQSAHAEVAELGRRLETLTRREREVLPLISQGLLNKQVAAKLGISEVTLQIHRGNVMRKMQAESFADLVRMSVKLGIAPHAEAEPTMHPGASRTSTVARDQEPYAR
ncbi:response regulator [Variovorax sp. J22R115]|nr:response regulator [Variovorax sp. J22R115]